MMPAEQVIAVGGAGGKTGRAVLAALQERGASCRPLVRRPIGVAGEVVVDLRDSDSLRAALEGASAVYHMAPNLNADEVPMGANMIAAAAAEGVERFVFHSVMQPQVTSLPHHANKLRVEEAVIASSLEWTILQPASYMQNLLDSPVDGLLEVPWRTDAPLTLVDLQDVGEVAAMALTEQGLEFGCYELCGPEVVSAEHVAALLGARIERKVPAKWANRMQGDGWANRAFHAMFKHFDDHGFVGNSTVLQALLGRAPNDLETVVRRTRKQR